MIRQTLTATALASILASHSWAQEPQKTYIEQRFEDARRLVLTEPVVALVDILPDAQQIAFASKSSGCRFYGKVEFNDVAHTWVMSINTESCGNVTRPMSAHILRDIPGLTIPEGSAILHAGDSAVLERNS